MSHQIRSACLTGYVELARSIGLDPYRLMRAVALDSSCLLDPDRKISAAAFHQLLETTAAAAGTDDFGVRLSETRRLSNLGPIALAIRNAATLREALETAIRYLGLHNEAMLVSIEPMRDIAVFKTELIADRRSPVRQGTELAVGVTYNVIRELIGEHSRSRAVWFSHGAPADVTSHLRVFGPWVEFGRDCNGILLEASDLDTPLLTADPVMARHVKRYLEPMLAQLHLTMNERVRRLVYDLLVSRHATVEHVASRFGITRRTLHRQLAEGGTTFSSIVDEVRADLAMRFVADSELPLSDVAHRLGFSDLSGFSRWFHNNHHCTPSSWRADRLGKRPAKGHSTDPAQLQR